MAGFRVRGKATARRRANRRRGASSLDYMIAVGVVMPLVTALIAVDPRLFDAACQIMCTFVSWPFM